MTQREHPLSFSGEWVIFVGHRMKSLIATYFHIWVTQQLKENIITGFIMDDERMEHSPVAGSAVPDYFDEMSARNETQKTGVAIAKNFPKADEITELNRIAAMWLNLAENLVTRRQKKPLGKMTRLHSWLPLLSLKVNNES